jgi:hypothetical protein
MQSLANADLHNPLTNGLKHPFTGLLPAAAWLSKSLLTPA